MTDLPLTPPDQGYLKALLESVGGVSGASILGSLALIIQLIMLLLRTKVGEMTGKHRLIIVYALSTIGGVFALQSAGMGFFAALIHSNTLASTQVFANQVWKQFSERPEDENKLKLPS